MFGLVETIEAISSRSSSDSERVLRLRTLARKVSSFAFAAWSICGSPIDSPRVGLGCSARTIWSAGTTPSPASARPAVIVNAAQTVIALIAECLAKLVIAVILKRSHTLWRLHDATLGEVQNPE